MPCVPIGWRGTHGDVGIGYMLYLYPYTLYSAMAISLLWRSQVLWPSGWRHALKETRMQGSTACLPKPSIGVQAAPARDQTLSVNDRILP